MASGGEECRHEEVVDGDVTWAGGAYNDEEEDERKSSQ